MRIEATSDPAPGSVIPSADLLAGDRGAQEALVLDGRAEVPDRWGGDPCVGAEPGPDAASGARRRQLLRPHRVVHVVAALAAE